MTRSSGPANSSRHTSRRTSLLHHYHIITSLSSCQEGKILNFCYECVTEVLRVGVSHIATGGALRGKAPTILYQLLLGAASWKLEKLELRRCPAERLHQLEAGSWIPTGASTNRQLRKYGPRRAGKLGAEARRHFVLQAGASWNFVAVKFRGSAGEKLEAGNLTFDFY